MTGTEKQIAYATALLEKVSPWVEIAKQQVPADNHPGLDQMLSPIFECADAGRLIAALKSMPTVCESGTHYSDGRAAYEIKPTTWQSVLQDAVLALR
jgi:hypothetical protein